MPIYLDRNGQRVAADEATIDGSKLRHGYQAVLEDGERASMSFRDGARWNSVTSLEVAKAAASHRRKFAFMGDRAPAFDNRPTAQVARKAMPITGMAIQRPGPVTNTRTASSDEMQSLAALRDAARANRYR